MGYILAAAMIGVWLSRGEVSYLFVSALFYIGASIGACAGNLRDDDENHQN